MDKVINVNIEDDFRIIAISDVHGHYRHLKRLIDKVKLKDEDYLVLVGDFINKGEDSYKTYEMVRKLSERKNTYVLKGNHEYLIQSCLEKDYRLEELFQYLKVDHFETIIDGMLNDANRSVDSFNSSEELRHFVHSEYSHAANFISTLPIILNLGEYRFVHGGYDEDFSMENEEGKFLKYDDYNTLGKVNDRMTIVGHWPACSLRDDRISNEPYINGEKKIIFIDGGLGITDTGELNAFIIEKKNGKTNYDCLVDNGFKKSNICMAHTFEKEEAYFVKFPDYECEIISSDHRFARCRHKSTKKELTIFKSLLRSENNQTFLTTDFINNFLNVSVGESVDVCQTYEDCAIVKYKDDFGWILLEQLA